MDVGAVEKKGNQQQQQQSETGNTNAVYGAYAKPVAAGEWILMVEGESSGDSDVGCGEIMVVTQKEKRPAMDSGCVTHVCPESHGSAPVDSSCRQSLKTATNEKIRHLGHRRVETMVSTSSGNSARLSVGYEVCDGISRPLVSVSKTADENKFIWFSSAGHGSGVAKMEDVEFRVKPGAEFIPLIRKNGLYELPTTEVFGVEDDEQPKEDLGKVKKIVQVYENRRRLDGKQPIPQRRLLVPDPEQAQPVVLEDELGGAVQSKAKSITQPRLPSKAEQQLHVDCGHVPFRAWCEECVEGQGKEKPHQKVDQEEHSIPGIEIDYCYLGDGSDMITVLTVYDRKSGAMSTTYVRKKGREDTYAIASGKAFVEWLGYQALSLRSDGESSITDVAKELKKQANNIANLEESPKESHSSLGGVENAHGRAAGVVRTLKRALEKRYKQTIKKQHPVMSWLVRHSGWSITRFQTRAASGRTPYEELRGKAYVHPMVEFGETVQFKAVGAEKDKLNPRYFKGIYVGRVDATDENLVLTSNGLYKARSIMRMVEEKRWDAELFESVIGTPWNPKSLQGHESVDNAVLDLSGKSNRGVFITKARVEEYGPTDGCPACERKSYNAAHSFKCRTRFEALLRHVVPEPKAKAGPKAKAAPKAAPKAQAKPMAQPPAQGDDGGEMEVEEPASKGDVDMEDENEGGAKRPTTDGDQPRSKKKRTEEDDEDMVGIVDTTDLVQEPEEDLAGEACADPRGLPEHLVEEGKEEERNRLKNFTVYNVRKRAGWDGVLVDGKWVHYLRKNKQTGKWEVRSRIVGREFNNEKLEDLFAGTPEDVVFRYLLSRAAKNKKRCILIIDKKSAFLHAPMKRKAALIPPAGEAEDDEIWELLKAVPGMRDASVAWQDFQFDKYSDFGYERSAGDSCAFFQMALDLAMMIHGDDSMIEGELEQLMSHKKYAMDNFECNEPTLIGLGPGMKREGKMLGRRIWVDDDGWHFEGDEKHVRRLLELTGLDGERTKAAPTPGSDDSRKDKDADVKLNKIEHGEYRSTTGVAQYAAGPRFDIKYSVKELARLASSPDRGAVAMAKRLGRYLVGRPRMVWHFWWQDLQKLLKLKVDANHAGCKRTGKSSTGMVVFLGRHVLVDLAITQVLISLSSGESEFYAIIKGIAEAIYLLQFLKHFNHEVEAEVQTDSSAAKGMTTRLGLTRRTRHINHKLLWVQQVVKDKRVRITKTPGEENESDLGTKYTTKKVQDYLLSKLPITFLTFAGEVIPVKGKDDLEEAQDRTIVSLAAMNGLLLVIVVVMTVIGLWLVWQNRVLRREVEEAKKKQLENSTRSQEIQVELRDETDSGASSSGINVPASRGISHMPTTTRCEECVLPKKRTTSRRPFEKDEDPTISADDQFPRVTTCGICGEVVNVWTVSDNRNGNRGRKFTKCSKMHFAWLDVVEWHGDVKRVTKKRGS